ncbi:GumA protein [Candidatus Moduliflexus flocculans]|uniref:GumA protein n=1 Tax=Candidatus Moduliflexus flocculans TaxID=1499966 RepID=A0A0S6W6J0_9BACT|nr:GumA protein [Candidatus Moduliflexus flocculans]
MLRKVTHMKMMKFYGWITVGLLMVSGCGNPATESDVSMGKTAAASKVQTQGSDAQKSSFATVMGMTQSPVKDKPGVTRVTLTLDREASFSTSREGNQLLVNVFNAQAASSLTPANVDDPVVKAISAKQTGSSVKAIIELVNADVAYTPSKAGDPSRILVDIWQIAPQAGKKKGESVAVITPSKTQEDTSAPAQKTKEVPVDLQPVGATSSSKSGETPSSKDMPAQLQWFSEKLSQVLQEREKMKQDLLEAEQQLAVKDSMIQVLERKIKEANLRIVELEEEVIKANSQTSLVAQNEQAIRNELQTVLNELEGVSSTATSSTNDAELKNRSDKILSKISELQKENVTLSGAKDQVDSLRQQVDALIKERDDLRAKNDAALTEIESLKGDVASLTASQQQLQAKERELAKLRKVLGDAAQLAMVESSPTVQPVAVAKTEPQKSEGTSQVFTTTPNAKASDEMPAQMIAQVTQMQASASPSEYILGPDDVLNIKVLNEENWDATVTVSSDGFITYSLLGDLRVDGLTTDQLDAQITSLLKRDFFVAPEVVVEVAKPRSKKVYIMGLVKQPGYRELEGDQRLLGTLLNAGGPSSFTTEAKILRLPKGDVLNSQGTDAISPIIVDLNKLFQQGDQTQNIQLQDGDVIMVAEKGSAATTAGGKPALGPNQIYVVGSVAKPGIYNYQDNDTVLDAILRAGGFTEFASRNGTKVVRDEGGKTKTIQVKMKDVMEKGEMDKNIPILGGDMIIVPESFF